MFGRVDDAAGISTLCEPSVLISDPGEVVERERDRDMARRDLLEMHAESAPVATDGFEVVASCERIEFPREFPTVGGGLGPFDGCERRADGLDPLCGINVIVGDRHVVVVNDAVGIEETVLRGENLQTVAERLGKIALQSEVRRAILLSGGKGAVVFRLATPDECGPTNESSAVILVTAAVGLECLERGLLGLTYCGQRNHHP